MKIAAGTQYVVESDLREHNPNTIRVMEGNPEEFAKVEREAGCLCVGIPEAGQAEDREHDGFNWRVKCLTRNEEQGRGTFHLTLSRDVELEDTEPALATAV